MIHYLILCALLAITLVGLVTAVATGLMLVAIKADQAWEQRNYDERNKSLLKTQTVA